jgi:hypothetical protein
MRTLATQMVCICSLLAQMLVGIAHANTVYEGETDGGALIKIEVPEAWNGGLVIYNHGFDLEALVPSPPSLGPLAALQLSEGYAVAASSYRQNGWALYKTKNDLLNLVDVFKAQFAKPTEIYLHGFSLGGIVTAQAIETNLGNVVGAYPACGAMAGSRSWDGGIDTRLIYDAICADVPGAFIPGGGTGLPERFTESDFTVNDFGGALQACFGIFAPPDFRTAAQAARLQRFMDVTQIPESFVATDMSFGVFALSDLIYDKKKLNGKQGMGNIGVTYNDADVDSTIERVATHPGGKNRHTKNFTPSGEVKDVKIISTHTSGDGLVIVEQQQPYRDSVPVGNITVAVVNEAGNTHCGFTGAELVAGWESLRGWVATDIQPTVANIQGTCLAIEAANIDDFPGPCRYDPTFVIDNMDGRSPPR